MNTQDIRRPKRPMTAYLLFYQIVLEEFSNKEEYKKPDDTVNVTEISKAIARKWKDMEEMEREKYKEMAIKSKEKYNSEMEEYMKRKGEGSQEGNEKGENKDEEKGFEESLIDDGEDDESGSISMPSDEGGTWPGVVGLGDVQNFSRPDELCIPKAKFTRLIQEVSQEYITDVKYRSGALTLIQEACETYLLGLLEDTKEIADHAKRNTVMPRDLLLARRIRRERY